jgi:hypothetical protein
MWGSYRDRLTATRSYLSVVAIAALLAWPALRPAPAASLVPATHGTVATSGQVKETARHGVGHGRYGPGHGQHLSTPSTTFVAEGSAALPRLAPLGAAPVRRCVARPTVGVRLAPVRAPPPRTGC